MPPQPTFQQMVNARYDAMMAEQGMAPAVPTPMAAPRYAPQPVGGTASPIESGAALGAKIALKMAAKKAAANTAASSGSSLAANAGANTAWNAGANAATAQAAGLPATPTVVGANALPGAAPTLLGNAASMGALPLAGIIAGLGLGAKGAKDLFSGKDTKGWEGWGGRATLGIATGGLSELARALMGRKTTKDYQRERWGELGKSEHAPTKAYADQYLNYLGSDQAATDALYENTLEGKRAAGTLGAQDVWGARGMFDTFKDDWLGKYSEDQRRSISQKLIDENLLTSSKGDTYITDQDRARSIADAILSAPTASAAPTRSSTSSPGISKTGQRVSYAKKK